MEDYSKILAKQLNENLTRIGRFNGASCSYAKYNLTAWNAKTGGDAFMYTISIMSTIGINTPNIMNKSTVKIMFVQCLLSMVCVH